jgi:hypothetical protein
MAHSCALSVPFLASSSSGSMPPALPMENLQMHPESA